MRWPAASTLLAVDRSMGMVQAVWPGNIHSRRWAVCGNWMELPQPNSSCAVVIGDGAMNCVKYPDGLRALVGNVRAVLRDDGMLLLRCFVRPDSQEPPEDVFSDLSQSKLPSVNHFKLRLMMAMQSSTEEGIAVNDVYEKWAGRAIDEECLMARTGWAKSAIKILEVYKGQDAVHVFPTLAEFRSVFDEFFDEISVSTPSYYLGDRCLSFVLVPRSGDSR